jgi:hypothetical protein
MHASVDTNLDTRIASAARAQAPGKAHGYSAPPACWRLDLLTAIRGALLLLRSALGSHTIRGVLKVCQGCVKGVLRVC